MARVKVAVMKVPIVLHIISQITPPPSSHALSALDVWGHKVSVKGFADHYMYLTDGELSERGI